MNNLSKKILATIVYYDILDYPLTSFEIWKHLISQGNGDEEAGKKEYSLANILKELEKDEPGKYLEEYRGFYFLKGRRKLVGRRIKNNKVSQKKVKAMRRISRVLRLVPYVRMIAVTGTVAMKNADRKSDLDMLIVLKRGKIFTGRTLVTAVLHLMGKRRRGRRITDRICLNYFITTESLEINLQDLFSSSEYSFIFPLFRFKYFRRFQKKNKWIEKYKPNFEIDEAANIRMLKDTHFSKAIRKTGEKLLNFDIPERVLGNWQIERIKRDPRTHQEGSAVMADSESLVFLPDPQGPKIYARFRKRMEKLELEAAS